MPVFWGTTFSVEYPLETSDYGFRPSQVYDLSVMVLSGPIKIKTKKFSFKEKYANKMKNKRGWSEKKPDVLVVVNPENSIVPLNFEKTQSLDRKKIFLKRSIPEWNLCST